MPRIAGSPPSLGSWSSQAPRDTTNHVLRADEPGFADGVRVPVTTFDALAADRCPVLAKIHVEGYETQVLAGAGTALGSPSLRGLILELNGSGERYGYSDAALFAAVVEAGFAPYRYAPFGRSLEALDGPNRAGGNTLFLRDLPFLQQRVRDAPPVRVRSVSF